MAHAMSDDQVAGELKKMTMFIQQEALEKKREIEIKADEEFAIEKSKLVRQETSAIDAQYEKKFKQASMSQQITRSTLANRTRLKVLSARQALLDELFEKAGKRLADFAKGDGAGAAYEDACRGLILQGVRALDESKAAIRARQEDYDVVRKAMEAAKEEYKKESEGNKEVALELDEKNPLPKGSYGGVVIIGGGGRIELNNTLEERLKLLETDALPTVRLILFGKNENRKFYD